MTVADRLDLTLRLVRGAGQATLAEHTTVTGRETAVQLTPDAEHDTVGDPIPVLRGHLAGPGADRRRQPGGGP